MQHQIIMPKNEGFVIFDLHTHKSSANGIIACSIDRPFFAAAKNTPDCTLIDPIICRIATFAEKALTAGPI